MASYGQLVGQPAYDDSSLFDRSAGAAEGSGAASSSSSSNPALKITVSDPLKKVRSRRTDVCDVAHQSGASRLLLFTGWLVHSATVFMSCTDGTLAGPCTGKGGILAALHAESAWATAQAEQNFMGVQGGYVTYRVNTQTSLPSYPRSGSAVRRRFRDFVVRKD